MSSKHEALNQCWFNVGPSSTTMAQHWFNIKSAFPFSGCTGVPYDQFTGALNKAPRESHLPTYLKIIPWPGQNLQRYIDTQPICWSNVSQYCLFFLCLLISNNRAFFHYFWLIFDWFSWFSWKLVKNTELVIHDESPEQRLKLATVIQMVISYSYYWFLMRFWKS